MAKTVSPNSHSVGQSTRQVTVNGFTADGQTAICIDKTGVEVRVPLLWQRAKGTLPLTGETWILSQDMGQWTFAMIVGSSTTPFTGTGVTGSTGTFTGEISAPQANFSSSQAAASILTVQNTHAAPTAAIEQLIAQAAADLVLAIKVQGDTQQRLAADSNGKLSWGSGTAAADVVLQRLSAAVAKLTGGLQITGRLFSDASWTTKSSGFSNTWTGTFAYMLLATNLMLVDYKLVPGASSTGDGTVIFTLPTAYQPTSNKHVPAMTDNVKVGTNTYESARCRIDNAGIVTNWGLNANATIFDGCGLVPLDV